MSAKIEVVTREQHGIRYVEDITPNEWVEVDVYTPCSTVTPWDYYGLMHTRPLQRVLDKVGIENLLLETRKTIIHPSGSGPKGMVRFGDNMMPHTYRIAVPMRDTYGAIQAIEAHKRAVSEWLDGKREMPEECGG
jgi:hypothetical protein